MKKLNPVKLHEIIGTNTTWTDELWNQALRYLTENTGTLDAIVMAEMLYGDKLPDHLHKIDFLREFHPYPPTVLLGAFDYMRHRKGAES